MFKKIAIINLIIMLNRIRIFDRIKQGDYMYAAQPKKLIIMNILDILKRYTDEGHRLTAKPCYVPLQCSVESR